LIFIYWSFSYSGFGFAYLYMKITIIGNSDKILGLPSENFNPKQKKKENLHF
jgi:hypothetical protein